MAVRVVLPQLGESVAEGTIVKWLKQEGDPVKEDESLAEVETDKVTMEIPSPASGVLAQILVPVGVTTPVETPIAVIRSKGEAFEAGPAAPAAETIEPASVEPVRGESAKRRRYSPLSLKLAAQYEVDLSRVPGTGTGGRVRKQDILSFVQSRGGIQAEVPPAAPTPPPSVGPELAEEVLPITPQRRLIAERMVQSKHVSPHVTTVAHVDMTRIVRWRERNKEEFLRTEGVKITYLPFVLKAVVRGLQTFPTLNARWEDRGIVLKRGITLGIAVATERGLVVPVVENAEEKNLLELAKAVQDLVDRARSRKLTMADLEGGTFTVTNPGVYGALFDTPIIHQPQAAILSMGAVGTEPVVINDAIAIRSMMYLSLSYDHRLNDGDTAVRFLQHVRQTLEEFDFWP